MRLFCIVLCSWQHPITVNSISKTRTCTSRLSGTSTRTRTRRPPRRPARLRTNSRDSWAASRRERQKRWTNWTRNARRRLPEPRSWWTAPLTRSSTLTTRSRTETPRRTLPGVRNRRRKSTSRTPPRTPRTPLSTRPITSWNPKTSTDHLQRSYQRHRQLSNHTTHTLW